MPATPPSPAQLLPALAQLRDEALEAKAGAATASPCCGLVCGGVVVRAGPATDGRGHEVWVLTAAHCVVARPRQLSVRLWGGEAAAAAKGISVDHPSWQSVPPGDLTVWTHPGYSAVTMRNDIALVRCRVEPQLAAAVRPVRLPAPGEPLPTRGTIVGFSLTPEGEGGAGEAAAGDGGKKLRAAAVAIERPGYRQRTSKHLVFDPRWHAWAVGQPAAAPGQVVDTCEGDSGGPLLDATGTTLVGLTSWGVSCGEARHPGVYALVQPFLEPAANHHPHTRRLNATSPWRKGLRQMLQGVADGSSGKRTATAAQQPTYVRDPPRLSIADGLELFAGIPSLTLLAALAAAALALGAYVGRTSRTGRAALITGTALAALAMLALLVTYC